MKKRLPLYALLIIIALGTVFPFIWMLATSFKTLGEVFSLVPKFLPDSLFKPGMWDNYKAVLEDYNFLRFVRNSMFVACLAAIGQLFACSMAGFAFARMTFRLKDLIFSLLIATMMVPVEVTIIPEYIMMLKLRWYDSYLPLIVPSALVGSFGTFLLRTTFENIPSALEDAAFIDGVSSFQMYSRVFLPNARPALASLFIIAFMNNWNDLLRPVIYLDTTSKFTATMGLMMFKGNYGTQWHLLAAASMIAVLPLLIVYLLAQKYFVEDLLTSGMKG